MEAEKLKFESRYKIVNVNEERRDRNLKIKNL